MNTRQKSVDDNVNNDGMYRTFPLQKHCAQTLPSLDFLHSPALAHGDDDDARDYFVLYCEDCRLDVVGVVIVTKVEVSRTFASPAGLPRKLVNRSCSLLLFFFVCDACMKSMSCNRL